MLNISTNSVTKQMEEASGMNTLKTLRTPRAGKLLARWLLGLFVLFILVLFLPWQQNVRGYGKVTAFTPANRPQQIETAIAGRINSWKVREGQYVSKGDTIMSISEIRERFFDPELLLRLEEQISAKRSNIEAKESKILALERQIAALKESLKFNLRQAENRIIQTQLKVTSDSMDLEAEKITFDIAKAQFERQERLYDQGLRSLTELENRKQRFQESNARLISVENRFYSSKNELLNARIQLSTLEASFLEKISKAESDRSATQADLYESAGSLAKLRNEYANMTIRNEQYHIVAPQDGFVVKALKAGIGETIKEGEAVSTIMPESPDMAVEVYIKAMDVPLLTRGRKVRLEFDGWPAIQFSGWPSVAVGTFGGVVEVIDFVNATEGYYRVLVTPDPEDDPWPKQLRMGSAVQGWAMLDEVPLWYEVWRQLNGFPPSLQTPPADQGFEGPKVIVDSK